jgi:hypothetical protein
MCCLCGYDSQGGHGRDTAVAVVTGSRSAIETQAMAIMPASWKKVHCPICEEAGKSPYIAYGHDRATCSHTGGDMEGRSGREECINHQRRIKQRHTFFFAEKEKFEALTRYS